MNATNSCEIIAARLGQLFECAPRGDYTRVRTPFFYPDGDIIDLYTRRTDGVTMVTDLGEGVGWLRTQTASARRSAKQSAMIRETCEAHGVELFRGMLIARSRNDQDLAEIVVRLAQAVIRVSDIWFTFRSRSGESLKGDVADFFEEKQVPFQRNEKMEGRSGKGWNVDFHTRTATKSTFLVVLSTGNPAQAQRLVEHSVTQWHDLSHLRSGLSPVEFVSLIDDSMPVWKEEHIKLLEDLSVPAMWSDPEALLEVLKAA